MLDNVYPYDRCPLASPVIKIINKLFSPTDTRERDNENDIMPEGKKKERQYVFEMNFLNVPSVKSVGRGVC